MAVTHRSNSLTCCQIYTRKWSRHLLRLLHSHGYGSYLFLEVETSTILVLEAKVKTYVEELTRVIKSHLSSSGTQRVS